MGVDSYVCPLFTAGHTSTGYVRGLSTTLLRNSNGASADDGGVLNDLTGVYSMYGHHAINTSTTPQTTKAHGLFIQPYIRSGVIGNMYDIYLAPESGGGTATGRWGICQANTANNAFAGNVRIGSTAAPTVPLDVTGIAQFSSNIRSAGNPVIYSYNGDTVDVVRAGIQLVGSDPSIRFTVASSERMRITATGNLLIGTTTDDGVNKLQVAGSVKATTFTALNGTGVGYVVVAGRSTDGRAELAFQNNGLSANNVQLIATTNNLDIAIGGSTKATVTSTGDFHTPAGATSMSAGFIRIPSAAGAPTGTPATISGTVPMYYDSINSRFYIWDGSTWKYAAMT
jgi:hypothetical protein